MTLGAVRRDYRLVGYNRSARWGGLLSKRVVLAIIGPKELERVGQLIRIDIRTKVRHFNDSI